MGSVNEREEQEKVVFVGCKSCWSSQVTHYKGPSFTLIEMRHYYKDLGAEEGHKLI